MLLISRLWFFHPYLDFQKIDVGFWSQRKIANVEGASAWGREEFFFLFIFCKTGIEQWNVLNVQNSRWLDRRSSISQYNFLLISSIANAQGFWAIWAILVTFFRFITQIPQIPQPGVLGAPHSDPQTARYSLPVIFSFRNPFARPAVLIGRQNLLFFQRKRSEFNEIAKLSK